MSENWMGTGAGNPGVMGAGIVREAGEERAGDGIPKGVAWEKGDIYKK